MVSYETSSLCQVPVVTEARIYGLGIQDLCFFRNRFSRCIHSISYYRLLSVPFFPERYDKVKHGKAAMQESDAECRITAQKSQCPLQGNARSAGVKPSLVRTLPDPLFPSFGASESPTWIPTCFSIRNTLLLSFLCERNSRPPTCRPAHK